MDKAIKILKKLEKRNGKKVDPVVYKSFRESCEKLRMEEVSQNTSYSVLDLFKSPRLRRITILLIIIWMAISLVFDGHVRNVGSLGLDLFLTFTVACFTEFPAGSYIIIIFA